jgi:hypothetical protein
MELQNVAILAVMVSLLLVLCLGLWALSLKLGKPGIKRDSIKIGIVGLLAICFTAWIMMSEGNPVSTHIERIPGPAKGSGNVTREINHFVVDHLESQEVEMKLLAYPDTVASGEMSLRFYVQDPGGKAIFVDEQKVSPATGIEWQPITFRLPAAQSGVYKLFVEIPQGVDMLNIEFKSIK